MNIMGKRHKEEDPHLKDAVEAAFQAPDNSEMLEDNRDRRSEKKIDKSLKETFPASDPPSINPGAD